MKRKKSGTNRGLRILLIAGLVAAALGITAVAAMPHLRERSGAGGEQTPQAAADPDDSWTGESSEGLITYQGKKYRYNSHLSNYLLLGIDTKGDIMQERETIKGGQSDAIFLVSYDRKEETVRLYSIPRDTMTRISIYDSDGNYLGTRIDHLTLQYAYGDGKEKSCRLARDAVSLLMHEIPIIGYAAVNLEAIPYLSDSIGGVTLTVPDDSLEDVYPEFRKGEEVTLTGENTERFLRYRDTHSHQQALVRMERQKSYVNAFANKVISLQKEDPHTVTDIYETLRPFMVTNMSNDIFLDLVSAKRTSEIVTIPGEGVATDLYDEYIVDEEALYQMVLMDFYAEAE